MQLARIAILLALPSCLLHEDEPQLDTAEQAATCAPSQCGNSNSPVIDGVLFWSLHPLGQENDEHVYIEAAFSSTGAALSLRTPEPGDRLVGVRLGVGGTVEHSGLVGTKLHLRVEGRPYLVTIVGVTPTFQLVPLWIDPTPRLELYEFAYVPIVGGVPAQIVPTPLCTTENNDPSHPMIRAAVFGRDVYSPRTKEVKYDSSPAGWFNIACEGGAPYKMAMIGYTQAAQNQLSGVSTTHDERQAMLRAWTADVCGTGRPFTRHGETITLSEVHGYLPATSPYISTPAVTKEAVWGPNGARCLDVPRLADTDALILDKIKAECGGKLPDPCGDTPPAGVVRTGNPKSKVISQ